VCCEGPATVTELCDAPAVAVTTFETVLTAPLSPLTAGGSVENAGELGEALGTGIVLVDNGKDDNGGADKDVATDAGALGADSERVGVPGGGAPGMLSSGMLSGGTLSGGIDKMSALDVDVPPPPKILERMSPNPAMGTKATIRVID